MLKFVISALALLAACTAAPLAAQDIPPAHSAAPYVSADEWPRGALRRLHALGLIPAAHDPSLWTTDRTEAMALFQAAVERAERDRPDALPLAQALADRFASEHAAAAGRSRGMTSGIRAGATAVGAGYRMTDGEVHTAVGTPGVLNAPPAPFPDVSAPLAVIDASGYAGQRLAGRVRLTAAGGDADGGLHLDELYAVVDADIARAWAGRRPVGLGLPMRGVILTGAAALDGVGMDVHAFRLPWLLEHLGTIRASTALGRIGDVNPFETPWLWSLRVTVQPHERFTVGLNRGAMVAAPDEEDENWLKQVAFVLVGKHSDELNRHDNQIASLDLAFRPPLGPIPLVTYLEWGLEDSAGAWRDVPGVVLGGYLGALPGVPWLAAGVEHASFAKSCCGNPWWYRHLGFRGGWTSDGRPLAHPLGGHGEETRASLDATLVGARLLIGADLYARERRSENLYDPAWRGSSTGASLSLSALIQPNQLPTPLRLELEAERETAGDWARSILTLRGSVLF